MERIRVGVVETANPFNHRQIRRIPIVPIKKGMTTEEGVDAFIFWTREPGKILNNSDELTERGFPFYVMVTITGYPNVLEPSMTPTAKVLETTKKLAQKIGQDRVIWRYDPVITTSITDVNFHRENFNNLAKNLAGSVKRVIVSMFDEYKEALKRLQRLEENMVLQLSNNNNNTFRLLSDFAESAGSAGMEIQSCAEKEDYSEAGIKPGACIDAALIAKLCGTEFIGKDKNQRPNCLCCKSVDIGAYGVCAAHCVYCYAWW